MSDTTSDADKIRSKRLAKLGGSAPSSAAANGETADAEALAPSTPENAAPMESAHGLTPETSPKPKINVSKPFQSSPSSNPSNPFAELGMKHEKPSTIPITIHSSKAAPQKPRADVDPSSRSSSRQGESVEVWEDRTLSNVFKITLKPEALHDAHGHVLRLVADVRSELEEQGAAIRLSTNVLEQALLEAAQQMPQPLDYLLGCWKRVSRLYRGMKSGSSEDPKFNITKEARRLCMSYCIFAFTIPDMFGQETTGENPLAKHLLVDPENDLGICHDFFMEATTRMAEDESIKDALVGAMEQLSRDLSKMSMNDDYKPYMHALHNFVRYPPLVVALTQSPSFLPDDLAPQDLESKTLLGPFFNLSPMQPDVATNYFSSPQTRDRAYIKNSQDALRMTLRAHQAELFDITNLIIKASKDPRERMLDWFAAVVNKNHKKRAMQVDPKTVSTDGFMVNVTITLDQLCEPFMDATFSKVDRIDADYLRRNPRVAIRDETKLNADQNTSDRFYDQDVAGANNFISEIFFLTVAAHHYGTEAANTKLSTLQREINHMEKQLEKFEAERHNYVHRMSEKKGADYSQNPGQLRMFEQALKRYRDQLEKYHCVVHATRGVLLDDLAQARSMLFMRYVIIWLLRLGSGARLPKEELSLPLPEKPSEVFACLPEYFLEDIVDNFKFITRFLPHIITSTQCQELVQICITFLRSSEYIKNPYLKSGLVTILFHGVWPLWNRSKGILGDELNGMPFALKHLLHALMKFYIEAESTGTHTQFFDKFNIRYEIFQVIRCIWSNSVYRENLATEARVNVDFFVRFVNLLLNDVTFVLDESFTAMNTIHSLQNELQAPAGALSQQERTAKEEALQAAEGKAKSYMQLTNETVSMLKLFTDALVDSFTMPEVVQRLADMLDHNLEALVGPKRKNLHVARPEDYGFNPRTLLTDIIDVYLNLGSKESFRVAVARDGRSYKPSNFEAALTLMKRHVYKSPDELERFAALAMAIARAKEEEEEEEQDMGEIPEEYLDPLVYTLMEDPVILPTSKTTIDRSTIRSHLLSDPTDPFNRSPLKIEDVIPDVEMKRKIAEFKRARRAAKQAATASTEPMDTS
ncbi:MAG: hypothetical protein M1822_001505 [Bathelium mastoideum]|nr:MAG: hypothetical protein M1822_001505 [Bathelium mastoideum]